ncbi:hypothetical protein BV22DRAFT_1028940 [Leucogyrophana mollusca]|uniref:Uncharacterized protein n=1 Tax=Leucogyrophana mollusca TaxID=85980 RepID=A0ACB8BYP9_9AGAM|nr:hypothetical protein BV22DRAFT_1028940 [Leucogyrophana mollusca]
MSRNWQLPGFTPKSARKGVLAKTFGFSRDWNKRNLEAHWYAFINHGLIDLTADLPNFIVCPQFPIYVTQEYLDELLAQGHLEDENALEGEDFEEGVEVPPAAGPILHAAYREDDQSTVEILANLSNSTASTQPEPTAKGVITDFAVLCIDALPVKKPTARNGGYGIRSLIIPLIVEQKRYTSRTTTGDAAQAGLTVLLQEAMYDVVWQAAHLFLQYKDQEWIVVIATSGPYWSNATLTRANVAQEMAMIEQSAESHAIAGQPIAWTKAIRMDLASSRDRLRTIHKKLSGLRVMKVEE